MEQLVDGWKTSLESYIEAELGPIPKFEYKNLEEHRPSYVPVSLRELFVPWMVSYENNTPLFLHNKSGIDISLCAGLETNDENSQKTALGYLTYALTHDIIHLYQMGPLMVGKGAIFKQIFWDKKYRNCLEGLAQLYTFKICNEMYENASDEDFSKLVRLKPKEFLTDALQNKQYKKSIKKMLITFLSGDTKELRDWKKIGVEDYTYENYDFDLNSDITDGIHEELKDHKIPWFRIPLFSSPKKNPYMWGALQLSKLIDSGKYTMQHFLENPVSNRKLDRLVRKL